MATTCTKTDLGSVLRHHRHDHGLTPEQVAVQLGCGSQTVMHWERNTRVPTLPRLKQLAELYGVDVGELASAQLPSATSGGAR